MRVLVVDDEPLARIGMRSIVPWEENGFTLVGEAKNGVEALELARKYRPDLILSDIVMPEMDGLTFIREVRRFLPDTRLIIMSCMSEAQYLQEAIRLGVSEYILKESIEPADIIEAVRRVAEQIRRERVIGDGEAADAVNRNLVITEFMNLVRAGRIRDAQTIGEKLRAEGLVPQGGRLAAACIGLDYPQEEGEGFSDYSALSVCQEVAASSLPGILFVSGKKRLSGLFSLAPSVDAAYLERFFRQLRDTALQCLDCTVTMGMSRPFADAGECFERFAEAEKAQENGFFYGKGRLFLFREEAPPEHEAFSQLNRLLKTEGKGALASVREQLPGLMACVRESGLSASRCGEVYRDVYSHVKGLIRVTCQDWEDPLLDRLHRFSSFEGFQDVQEYAEAFAGFLEEAERELSLRRSAGGESVIRSIRLYVEQHLEEKITLETVSRSVYLSPSYVCRIFKRETGENLQDYIMDKKLERAAVLLREKKVGEVSDQLAFSSHSYFIKLFKEKYQMTPFQYQKR